MKKLNQILAGAIALLFSAVAQPASAQFNWPWKWQNHTIVTDVPERPAGQEDVLNLTTPKLSVVRVGFVGLGMRGPGAVERWCHIPGVQIVALCDYGCPLPSFIRAKRDMKNFASVKISTSSISQPIGSITSLWPSVLWRMANMRQSRFPQL